MNTKHSTAKFIIYDRLCRTLLVQHRTYFCDSDPNEVESSGRKALYKVMSDLFALYKVEQPTSLYEVTPHTINVYATTYAKYVLKRPVPEYTDMLEWGTMMQDIFSAQRGNSWQTARLRYMP